MVWDGKRWCPDQTGEVVRKAKQTAASIYQEAALAAQHQGQDAAKAVAKWAARSHQVERINAMLRMAESEPGIPVTPEELDREHWLLNVLNGTIDLRTGQLMDRQRDHLITKLAPVKYEAEARCPKFFRFLRRIMDGNPHLIKFLRQAIGYSLTGDISEQVLFVFWGAGANGKSTLMNLVMKILGDYSKKAPGELLMAKRGEVHPTEKTILHGARLVAAIETEEGRRLSETVVKELTGGDPVTARRMREDFWTFDPTHKLFLITNYRPQITASNEAMWRRVLLLPFEVIIPESERDKSLAEALLEEGPGILAWAVRGCLRWQRNGLYIPPEIRQATAEYREEMDMLADFLEERCILEPSATIRVRDFYLAYRDWAEATGEDGMGKITFGNRLRERGFSQDRNHEMGRYWVGVRLSDQD